MAVSFPVQTFSDLSSVLPLQNMAIAVGDDGSFGARQVRAVESLQATLVNSNLSAADAASIETFYNTNETEEIEFGWRDIPYRGFWVGKPIVRHVRGDTWTVESRLIVRPV